MQFQPGRVFSPQWHLENDFRLWSDGFGDLCVLQSAGADRRAGCGVMGPSESCGLCVSLTEKQLVAGEPTEEMFYLKDLHSRSCLPPVARGQGSELGHQDVQALNWGGSPKRMKSLR